jgi:Na+-transporting methylmalonyl-CoA/oxaloacetate decarboxylase gamma subunit
MNKHAVIEGFLGVVFSVLSVLRLCSEGTSQVVSQSWLGAVAMNHEAVANW